MQKISNGTLTAGTVKNNLKEHLKVSFRRCNLITNDITRSLQNILKERQKKGNQYFCHYKN